MPKPLLPLHLPTLIKDEATALVAGGAGFLGSHLCEKLLETCRVICLDKLTYGKRENIGQLLQSEKFTFIEYDITRPLNDLFRKKVNYVFDVAGVDEVARHKNATLDDLLLNTHGTKNLLEKAVSDKAKFLLISTLEHEGHIDETINAAQARLFSERITLEYVNKFGINGRVIRVAHLFGPRMPLDTQNPLSVVFKELSGKDEAVIAADPLTRLYPIYIYDCVSVVLENMFSAQSNGKIFNLIPARSITLLELADVFGGVDPRIRLIFSEGEKDIVPVAKEHLEGGTTLTVETSDKLERQVSETLSYFRKRLSTHQSGSPIVRVYAKKKKHTSPFRFISLLFLGSALFFSTILPFLLLILTSFIGIAKLNSAQKDVADGKLAKAYDNAKTSQQFFETSQTMLWVLSYHFALVRRQRDWEGLFLLLKSGEDASISAAHLARGALLFGEFFRESVKGLGSAAKPKLDEAIGEVNAAGANMPILEKELDEVAAFPLPAGLNEYVRRRQIMLTQYKDTVVVAKTFTTLLPDLLGFEDKRTYLILFQNNMELRPTGGFIGSYGLLTFEKGSLSSFEVFDVYQADGQLRGHVEPPPAIRKYLNAPNWFLRDSNWDPDFQNSAAQASWFLQKEVGVSTHGVIAVDISFVQFLIEAVGPVSVPDYKETVTKDNLFERAQAHAEVGFFPGSTQKKDFLGALSRRLIDRLLHEEDVHWLSVLSAIKKGVLEKHTLFSFNNPAIQQMFTLNNWGGTILTSNQKEGQFSDFRMINEANLGVNKANAFLKRKVSDEIIIGNDGEVTGALSIQYTNDGPNSWPGGPYVNYLRLFFPQNTKITEITIDGQEATASSKIKRELISSEIALEVEEASQSGKSIFGFLMMVPTKTTKLLSISYELPKPFPVLPGSSYYSYVFQKQPGTKEDPLSVVIHYPQSLVIKDTNAQVFRENQIVTLSTNLSEDRLFEVEFLH